MSELLKNKLSIGLSLDISLEEYKILFEKYKFYIHDIYFSLPLGDKYHSRSKIAKQFLDKENINKFYDILELARSYGIKLDCVLKRPTHTSNMIEGSLEYISNLNVDQITCLDCHIDVLKERFKDIP